MVTFVSGTSHVKRNDKKNEIKTNQVLFEGDVITTEKSQVHIQFSDSVIVKILAHTQITIEKDLRIKNKKNQRISVRLQKGRIFNKIIKSKLNSRKGYSYIVTSPSFVAGVRGTEFLASEENISKKPKGVFVTEGKVEVSPAKGARVTFQKTTLTKEKQLLIKNNRIKRSILDNKIKKEMQILSQVKFMSRENYKRLIKFKEKSQKLLDKIKKQNPK